MISVALVGLLTVMVVSASLWLVSLRTGRVCIVDVFWPILHLLPVVTYWMSAAHSGKVQTLSLVLLSVWAVRLATHLAIRRTGADEDRRYQTIRANNQPGFEFSSLYIVFGLQGMLAWLVSSMFIPIMHVEPAWTWLATIGALITVAGIAFETVADLQLARFLEERDGATVLTDGLWRFSRHPNYFGEFCVWLGFTLISVAHNGWYAPGLLGLVAFLLLRFSGVRLMEATIHDRRTAYADYAARTNAFFPGPASQPQLSICSDLTNARPGYVGAARFNFSTSACIRSQHSSKKARCSASSPGISENGTLQK